MSDVEECGGARMTPPQEYNDIDLVYDHEIYDELIENGTLPIRFGYMHTGCSTACSRRT